MSSSVTTALQMIWDGLSRPSIPEKKNWGAEPAIAIPCACCGGNIAEVHETMVAVSSIVTKTFSGTKDYFSGGYVCYACAYLFAIGSKACGSYLTANGVTTQPNINPKSNGRPSWLEALRELAHAAPDTPCAGIMTTDFKIRKFTLIPEATRGAFGLFVHAPIYECSGVLMFDLDRCLEFVKPILAAKALGFGSRNIFNGLFHDAAGFVKHYPQSQAVEDELRAIRHCPEFIPALLIAHEENDHE